MSRERRVGRAAVAGVVVLLLVAGLAGFAAVASARATADRGARAAAMKAATSRLPKLLSYRYTSLQADEAVALAQATGGFRSDYAGLWQSTVLPTAGKEKISSTAKVSVAGVVRGDRHRVVVLAFLTQSTTIGTAATKAPQVAGSRVNVTMTKTSKGWRIAGLDPV